MNEAVPRRMVSVSHGYTPFRERLTIGCQKWDQVVPQSCGCQHGDVRRAGIRWCGHGAGHRRPREEA